MSTDGGIDSNNARSIGGQLKPLANTIRQVPLAVWRRICVVLLLLWLCYSLAQLFWIVMPKPDIAEPSLVLPSNSAFSNSSSTDSSSVDVAALQNFDLFGKSSGLSAAPVAIQIPEIDQAVDTRLKLILRGTMPSNDESLARAVIGDGPKQKTFSIGEELSVGPRGVKLSRVFADRVILDNNGRYENLPLYQSKDDYKRLPQPARSVSQQTPTRRPAGSIPISTSSQNRTESDGIDASSFVESIRPDEDQDEPTQAQINAVTDVMNIGIHRENGQVIGFRIRPKNDRKLFDELGLQPGDIVTAVNNVGLTDTNKAMEIYRSLGSENQATLEILRDGATLTIDVAVDR